MGKELWLLRHGKAHRDVDVIDYDRPLKKRGQQDATQIGVWMKQHGYFPDRVFSSPARRAIDTAVLACAVLGVEQEAIRQDSRLYFHGLEGLTAVLASCRSERCVLIVGHNPDLEDALVYLVGAVSVPHVDKLLPTAAMARLLLPNKDWGQLDPGCAELASVIYPKSLPGDGL